MPTLDPVNHFLRYDVSNPADLLELIANGLIWKMGHHAQDLAMEALIDGRAPMNDKVPPQIAEWVTARQAEKRTSPTGRGSDPQAATEAVTRAGPTRAGERWLVPEAGTDVRGVLEAMTAGVTERGTISKAVKDGRAQINDYRFPDHAYLRNVTLRTALIDGRLYGCLLGTVSEACRYSEDAAGHLTAAHEIDVTTDFVDLAKVTDLPHRVDYIDKSEEVRVDFAYRMVGRAKADWDDDKCRRRKGYEARVAAKQERERAARLGEAEAELWKERARSELWRRIAIVLAIFLVVILVSHPHLIGL